MKQLTVILGTLSLLFQAGGANSSQSNPPADSWVTANLKAGAEYKRGALESAAETLKGSINESKRDTSGVRQIITLRNLAHVYLGQGKYKNAEKIYRFLLAAEEHDTQADPVLLIPRLADLAHFYTITDRPALAGPHLERILEIKKRCYGANSADLNKLRLELIAIYGKAGGKAGDAQQEAARVQKLLAELGTGQSTQAPAGIKTLIQLCRIYDGRELPEQAKPLVAQGIKRLESKQLSNNATGAQINRLTDIIELKSILHQPLQPDCQRLFNYFDQLDKQSMKRQDPAFFRSLAQSLQRAATHFSKLGEFEQSLEGYRRAVQASTSADDESMLHESAKAMVFALLYLNRTKEAVVICKKYDLPVAVTFRNAADNLYYLTPNFLMDHKNHLAGERIAKAAIRLGNEEGAPTAEQAASEQSLAQFYHVQHRFSEAEPLCRHSIKQLESEVGTNSLAVAGRLVFLAHILVGQKKNAEARTELRRAWRIYITHGRIDTALATYLNESWKDTNPPKNSSIESESTSMRN